MAFAVSEQKKKKNDKNYNRYRIRTQLYDSDEVCFNQYKVNNHEIAIRSAGETKRKAKHSTAVKTQETQGGKSAGALPAGEPTEEVKEQRKESGDNEAEVEHLRE